MEGGNSIKNAKIGELYKLKVILKLSKKESKKLNISVIASGSMDAKQALLTKNEKGMLYKGKKTFLVETTAEKEDGDRCICAGNIYGAEGV